MICPVTQRLSRLDFGGGAVILAPRPGSPQPGPGGRADPSEDPRPLPRGRAADGGCSLPGAEPGRRTRHGDRQGKVRAAPRAARRARRPAGRPTPPLRDRVCATTAILSVSATCQFYLQQVDGPDKLRTIVLEHATDLIHRDPP